MGKQGEVAGVVEHKAERAWEVQQLQEGSKGKAEDQRG